MDEPDLGADIRRTLSPINATADMQFVYRRRRVIRTWRLGGGLAAAGLALLTIAWPLVGLSGLTDRKDNTGVSARAAPTLVVTCDGETTSIGQSEVGLQEDGVHVIATNTSEENLGLQVRLSGGRNLPPGTSSFVFPLSPGDAGITCADPKKAAAPVYTSFKVVDVTNTWISPDVECDSARGVGFEGFPVGASAPGGLVDVVRERAGGLPQDAEFEPAGVQSEETAAVRVVEHGRVIASFSFQHSSQTGWELWSIEFCDGVTIGWH